MVDVIEWLRDHLYVPILIGVAVIGLIILILWCYCRYRRRRRFDYTALREDMSLPLKMQMERQRQHDAVRESALINCQFYLRSNAQYDEVVQLNDIGSRLGKHWFLVRDTRTRMEKLLTTMPRSDQMLLPFTPTTRKCLSELFTVLQHPYIYPILDLDLVLEQNLVVIVHPYNLKGTLKDVIYQSKCLDDWQVKYGFRSRALPVNHIQQYGFQILQALLFLEEKGFPPYANLHSGNVIVQNGICRLTAYENVFLGNISRLSPIIKKKLRDTNTSVYDSLCFGHLIFEMCTGFELDSAHPEPRHLVTCQQPFVVQLLNFIFEHPMDSYPSIREISQHEFFRNVQLPELQMFNPVPIHLTQNMKSLLKSVRKGRTIKSKAKRQQSTTSESGSRRKRASSMASNHSSGGPPGYSSVPPPPPAPPMAVPPPPPAPPSMPSGTAAPSGNKPAPSGNKSALFGAIRQGTSLKRSTTNDRSAPKV